MSCCCMSVHAAMLLLRVPEFWMCALCCGVLCAVYSPSQADSAVSVRRLYAECVCVQVCVCPPPIRVFVYVCDLEGCVAACSLCIVSGSLSPLGVK
jgi:hypothetical protein